LFDLIEDIGQTVEVSMVTVTRHDATL